MSRPTRRRIQPFLIFALCLVLALPAAALQKKKTKAGRPARDRSAQADRPSPTSRESSGERPTREFQSSERQPQSVSRDAVPEPNPQQQANLQELHTSLGTLAGGAAAAEDEIRGLAQDLQGMALQPPDPALTQALAADLAAAMDDASLSPKEMAQLTQDVYEVMNSAGLSQQELAVLKDDVEDILTASGVDRGDVEAVLDDLQAIYDASSAGQQGNSTRRARASKLGRDG